MIYQEKFEITPSSASYFSEQFEILITGPEREDDNRCMYFRKAIPLFKGLIYRLDTCDNGEQFHYSIEDESGNIVDSKRNMQLIPDLQNLISKGHFSGSKICIDITALKQVLLFLLVKIFIDNIKPSKFFAAYTEPVQYKKRKSSDLKESEEFDLNEKILGSSKGVPGFIKHQTQNDILLIAPMGFDAQRLQNIYENLKPKSLIPIVGFPSFVPGWNLTAIKMNFLILKNADCYDMIEGCEAASPFALYNLLKQQFDRHNNSFDIYISPLGTRPHCLGAAIFVTKYPSTYLIYDFPIEKTFRSESVLKTNVYHLSKYIN